jgi:NADH-quinone oxidoreductase subunit J
MIAAFFFYVFAAIVVASAAMVVTARNPVHCVLFLILTFFNSAALFVMAGAEFLAMILVIVYLGAVAVLFLFVVMMLDIDFEQIRGGFQRYAPIGAAIGIVLLVELGITLGGWKFAPDAVTLRFAPAVPTVTNTEQLGQLLYTEYVLLFQAAGLILLVAMIGAIVLTLRDRTTSRHQDIGRQLARHSADTMVFVEVRVGAGAKETGILRPPESEPEPVATHAPHGGH